MRGRAVVVSGGAINTPAILLRSGLKHPMIGRHLCLHPALVVGGVFPQDYGRGDDEHHDRQLKDKEKRSYSRHGEAGSGSMATAAAGKQVGDGRWA